MKMVDFNEVLRKIRKGELIVKLYRDHIFIEDAQTKEGIYIAGEHIQVEEQDE